MEELTSAQVGRGLIFSAALVIMGWVGILTAAYHIAGGTGVILGMGCTCWLWGMVSVERLLCVKIKNP